MAKRRKPHARRASRRAAPSEGTAAEEPSDGIDFAAEYGYVLGDLRRIGLLALAMFATLVALALIIR